MTRLRRWPVVLALAAVVLAPGGPDAGAQTGARIDLVEQTLRIGPEPAFIDIRVGDPPEDARLAVCISPPLTDRDRLRAAHEAAPRNCTISNFDEALQSLAVADKPGRYRITIPDEPPDGVGELLRRDVGALPVVLTLEHSGRVLDEVVTQFLVLDDEGPEAGRVAIGLLAELRAPVAHLADQTLADPSAAVADGLSTLERIAGTPAAVALGPETVTALATTAPDTLADVVSAVEGRDLLLEPWVVLDEEAWRDVGETDVVLDQYTRGRATVEADVGAVPSGIVRADADAVEATIGLLRAAGATGVVLDPDRTTIDFDEADARPVQVRDENGVPMTALVLDERLITTLAVPDPELAATRAIAELLLLTIESSTDHAVLLDLVTLTPESLTEFLGRVDAETRIDIAPVSALFDAASERTAPGSIAEIELRPRPAPDVGTVASARSDAEARVDAFATMVTTTDAPIAPLRTLLAVAPAAELPEPNALAYVDAAQAAVAREIADVAIVDSERITLATRTADLPLTIRNDQTVALTVEVALRSEKLRFPEGDRLTIDLVPGVNALTVPVETQASGDAQVAVELTSPDGRLAIDDNVVRVRSTALSGIGLLISAVALSVLLVWWVRTVRRTRRARSAATVAGSDTDEADPDQGVPVGPDHLDVVSGEEP